MHDLLRLLQAPRTTEATPAAEETNLLLAREWLRRSAVAAMALGIEARWPFFDAAEAIDPSFDLPAEVAAELERTVLGAVGGRMPLLLCASVRWQMLCARTAPPASIPEGLYDPVVALHRNGGALHAEHHMILVPVHGFVKGTIEANAARPPWIEDAVLQALLAPNTARHRYAYAHRWFRGHKRPIDVLTEEQARQRHERGEGYVVLAGDDPMRPFGFAEVGPAAGAVGVTFFDERMRCRVEYGFRRMEARSFLGDATIRTFDDATDKVLTADIYAFTPDGGMRSEHHDTRQKDHLVRTAQLPVDTTMLWAPPLRFGDWDDYFRFERLRPN
jgi:hypothetical protein